MNSLLCRMKTVNFAPLSELASNSKAQRLWPFSSLYPRAGVLLAILLEVSSRPCICWSVRIGSPLGGWRHYRSSVLVVPTISPRSPSGPCSSARISGYLFSVSLPDKYLWMTLDSSV